MKIRWIISAVLIAVAVVGISFADTWMKDTGYEINGTTLDFDIWQQLHNIGTTTISATQWGYLGGQDQSVATTDTPTFAGLTLTDAITGLNYTINANSLQEGLVGFWGFEYGSGGTAYDSSREGNDGTLVGMDNSTCWVAGKDGTALEFDGSGERVYLGNLSLWKAPVSMSVWAKHASGVATSGLEHIFRVSGTPTDYSVMAIGFNYAGGTDETLNMQMSSLNETNQNIYVSFAPGDDWHFYTMTFDENYLGKVYADGELLDEYQFTADLYDELETTIGAYREDGLYDWNGTIDNFRVYNRALSEEEIQALYLGLGSQPTGHLALK